MGRRAGFVASTTNLGSEALSVYPYHDIVWQAAPADVAAAISQTPVDILLVGVRVDSIDTLMSVSKRARAIKPDVRIEIASTSSSGAWLLAEVKNPDSPKLGQVSPHLSHREAEVLEGIRRGYRNREISRDLGIAVSTVNRHVEHILHKLGVRNRAQAVAYQFGPSVADLTARPDP
jgi:DNA-binding NarL/FixJ family response regulator